jgi:hypothetical protein
MAIASLLLILPHSVDAGQGINVWGSFGEGLNFMPADSSFSVKMRLRFQTQINGQFNTDPEIGNFRAAALIRRMRLRFEGFALSAELVYKVQLNGSNEDMESTRTPELDNPGILRDAVLQWTFMPGTVLWFGQAKLPGNRQRVVSSANQEFVDRSNLNRVFNIDRDIGVQLHNQWNSGNFTMREILALSTGEGRNRRATTGGWCITGRVEMLPFGTFSQKGDYFEGDLVGEKSPKLSVAATYSYNADAARTGGQLGEYLYAPSDMTTIFADAVLKYQGLAISGEFAKRSSPAPISTRTNSKTLFIYEGTGVNVQTSYMLTDKFQCALRYTSVIPGSEIAPLAPERTDYTLGLSHYFKGHDLKLQGDISYITEQANAAAPQIHSILIRLQTDFTF